MNFPSDEFDRMYINEAETIPEAETSLDAVSNDSAKQDAVVATEDTGIQPDTQETKVANANEQVELQKKFKPTVRAAVEALKKIDELLTAYADKLDDPEQAIVLSEIQKNNADLVEFTEKLSVLFDEGFGDVETQEADVTGGELTLPESQTKTGTLVAETFDPTKVEDCSDTIMARFVDSIRPDGQDKKDIELSLNDRIIQVIPWNAKVLPTPATKKITLKGTCYNFDWAKDAVLAEGHSPDVFSQLDHDRRSISGRIQDSIVNSIKQGNNPGKHVVVAALELQLEKQGINRADVGVQFSNEVNKIIELINSRSDTHKIPLTEGVEGINIIKHNELSKKYNAAMQAAYVTNVAYHEAMKQFYASQEASRKNPDSKELGKALIAQDKALSAAQSKKEAADAEFKVASTAFKSALGSWPFDKRDGSIDLAPGETNPVAPEFDEMEDGLIDENPEIASDEDFTG